MRTQHKPSYILINSQPRSGSSLLARMFDGHSNLCVFPHEMRFSIAKDQLPPLEMFRTDDFEAVKKMLNTQGNFSKTKLFSKQQYKQFDIAFDYKKFEDLFRQFWEKENIESRTMGRAFLSQAETFFRVVDDGRQWKENNAVQYFVGHCARSWLIPADKIFKEFPDGYIIQLVRDPRAVYISKKWGHDYLEKNIQSYRESHMTQWINACVQAFKNAIKYPERYYVMKYEDLVINPEEKMRDLSDFLGIPFENVLLKPQYFGNSWEGNSTFGPTSGVDKTRLQSWDKKLTEPEIRSIEKITGYLMHHLGYPLMFEKFRLSYVPEFINLFYAQQNTGELQKNEEKMQQDALARDNELGRLWRKAYDKDEKILKRISKKIKLMIRRVIAKLGSFVN